MPTEPLDIFAHYDKQRFTQFGSRDAANWYKVAVGSGKKQTALYPSMGRSHINFFGQNRLIFEGEPKAIFASLDFLYVIVGTTVIQVDKFWNEKKIGTVPLGSEVWFAYLPVGTITYCILTAETVMYAITENGNTVSYDEITDPNAPTRPQYVAAFGNRFVVSQQGTPDYYLSQVNLGGSVLNAATAFTVNSAPLFNRASGVIKQFAVLHNQLYIFSAYTIDPWSNIPSFFTVAGVTTEFPWKLNASYNFDYGLVDPKSLDVAFGMMAWLGQNRKGQVSVFVSNGGQPSEISTDAVDVIIADSAQAEPNEYFLSGNTNGFFYEYENTIFYRISAGDYKNFGNLDNTEDANCLEFNFDTQTWSRAIELNGERNRAVKHAYFNDVQLVTVQDDPVVYEFSGHFYYNELRNESAESQAADAFLRFPMRYTLVTDHIYEPDYSEFITDYVEIDFVFGNQTFYKNNAPFNNTEFLVAEDEVNGEPVYLTAEDEINGEPVFFTAEGSNTPQFDDNHYNALFKPHIELYWSDDGGVSFHTADLREFSPLGQYRWRMKWWELGASRNRVYKLVAVSSAPIVILGATQMRRRASGGAN